ncbi:hypothetical protein CBR_g37772 [Chara braunii]|uniref:DUF659 domain-containing protein n=1 Tax=Chara braunii TaxID=69332 RepID=A0A388LNQ7_CHABU|nr:hypothetical protein CBR_g37772 [Chara braunii]|eukprot:GBG83901.1 hypothetical protein CBR_g37772 [Chara braunii]
MATGSRWPRGGQLPPFVPVPAHKQAELRRTHVVWEWAERGQEWGLTGGGNFLLRCRRCGEVFTGSRSRAVEHFAKPRAHCPRRNGEILYRLQAAGALLRDALSLRLAAEHVDRMDGEFAAEDLRELEEPCDQVRDCAGGVGDGDRGEGGTQQGPDVGTVTDELRGVEGVGDGGGDGGGDRVTGTTATTSTQVVPRRRRTTLDIHLGSKVQRDLDRMLALAIYRGGVPFNWLRLKETQDYWNYIVTLMRPSIVPVPRLLTYEGVRTRMMDIIFHEVAALIAPKKAKWATTGCTLLTDGATDTTNKPIMNFIAAGQSGLDMSHREKTGVGLADIWEGDIGIDKENAICTDNAEVMKTAAGILQSHPDPAMRRIPWIPCAAHCLSLLLRDIASQPWAATVMKKAHNGDAIWDSVHDAREAMAPCYRFLRGMDRDGSSPTGLWDLESILRGRVRGLGLTEDERRAIMDIISDRCRMMRQPAHAAAYLLDPRRRDISLLTDRSSPVVQSALDHLARCQGAGWESDSLHKLWQALWTFHCEDPRYWPKNGAHWWDEFAVKDAAEGGMHAAMWWELHGGQEPRLQTIVKRVLGMWSTASPCERNWSTHDFIHTKRRNRLSAESVEKLVFIHGNLQLLSASRRTDRRYIDVWEDHVEDPAEEIDGDDSIPAEVPEEEWEEIDKRNRRKEGRNRFGKGKAPMEDEDEDEEGDEALWQDASVDTVRSLRGRVGGRLDLEELLTGDGEASGTEVGQEEERGQHIPHSSIAGEGGHTGGVPVDARTSAPAAPHHAAERILRGPEEEMIGREGHHADERLEDTHHVRQVTEQVVHRGGGSQSITQSVVQRVVLRGGDGDGLVAGGGGERRVSDVIRLTVVQTSEQRIGCASSAHVSQRVDDRADPLPVSVAELGAEQRVEQTVDEMVQDRAEQRADQRIKHRRERRDGHSLEVQVDVTMDESVVRRVEDRGSETRGVASTRESMIQSEGAQVATQGGGGSLSDVRMPTASFYGIPPMSTRATPSPDAASVHLLGRSTTVGRHGGGTSSPAVSLDSSLHHPPSVTLRRPAAHASRASTSSAAAAPPVRSPLGMPPLPARLPSAIVDNVKTSRAGRKRRREDDGGALPPPPRSQGGTGRPRGRPRGSGSGRGRGRGRDSWAMSALGAYDAGEDDVGQGTTACTNVTVGVRTRSQASSGVWSKKSTRIIDDDSDAASSDGLSGSDYVDDRGSETRARGEDQSGHDDSSDGNGHEED